MQYLFIFFLFNIISVNGFNFNKTSRNIIWDKIDFIDKEYITLFSNIFLKKYNLR